jgi:hypothetical protein
MLHGRQRVKDVSLGGFELVFDIYNTALGVSNAMPYLVHLLCIMALSRGTDRGL